MPYFDSVRSPLLADLLRLDGRVALVPGGAGYLGSQAADVLAELGATVVVAGRDLSACRTRAAEISERHECRVDHVRIDVTDTRSIREAMETILSRHSRLDILANFAWSGQKHSLESIDENSWLQDLNVSLSGAFRLAKEGLPLLREQGGGVILNVGSMYGHVAPDPGLYPSAELVNPPSYGAAKAGVVQLTRYLATFLAPSGIRANCISPGPFPFPETTESSPEFHRRLSEHSPMGRVGKPSEIRGAVGLLCSDAASYITGQTFCIDGGWTIW